MKQREINHFCTQRFFKKKETKHTQYSQASINSGLHASDKTISVPEQLKLKDKIVFRMFIIVLPAQG